jgi:hypothetical protein
MMPNSIRYFFPIFHGQDVAMFEGLTERLATGRIPQIGEHDYYQWPLLFVLARIVSDTTLMSVEDVARILFLTWSAVFVAGLFLYTKEGNDLRDFLSVCAYCISVYAYLNWQFSPWTFGSVLLMACIILVQKDGIHHRIALMVLYVALIFSHAFLAVFFLLTTAFMAIRESKYTNLLVVLASLYALHLSYRAVILFPDLVSLGFSILSQYSTVAARTLTQSATPLDAFAQTISRFVTISMWGLLGLSAVRSLVLRKLRTIDVSFGLSGIVYGIAGSVFAVLGYRVLQVVFFPTLHALRSSIPWRRPSRLLLGYFLLVILIFPMQVLHIFYDNTTYMTLRDKHAANTVFVGVSEAQSGGDAKAMLRPAVYGYLGSKSSAVAKRWDVTAKWDVGVGDDWWSMKARKMLVRADYFHFIFMSPELEKDLAGNMGLSESQLLELEGSILRLSIVYSNGHVIVAENLNSTRVQEA